MPGDPKRTNWDLVSRHFFIALFLLSIFLKEIPPYSQTICFLLRTLLFLPHCNFCRDNTLFNQILMTQDQLKGLQARVVALKDYL